MEYTALNVPQDVVEVLSAEAASLGVSFEAYALKILRETCEQFHPRHLEFEELKMDRKERTVQANSVVLKLTGMEFSLLECLMLSLGIPVSRDTIIRKVWGKLSGVSNKETVLVRALRTKLKNNCPASKVVIQSVRGQGYILSTEDAPYEPEIPEE